MKPFGYLMWTATDHNCESSCAETPVDRAPPRAARATASTPDSSLFFICPLFFTRWRPFIGRRPAGLRWRSVRAKRRGQANLKSREWAGVCPGLRWRLFERREKFLESRIAAQAVVVGIALEPIALAPTQRRHALEQC